MEKTFNYLSDLFDYAGMFPPASLDLKDSVVNASQFGESLKYPELVGSELVLTVPVLKEFVATDWKKHGVSFSNPFRVCVLGSPVMESSLNENNLSDWHFIHELKDPKLSVVSFEVKVGNQIDFKNIITQLSQALSPEMRIALEPDLSGRDYENVLGAICTAISEVPAKQRIFLKVRGRGSAGSGNTGIGVERLAKVIEAVSDKNIQLKATAALHHPLPEQERYGNELGFVNLWAALHLRRHLGAKKFSTDSILQCLKATDAHEFHFQDGNFAWQDFQLSAAEISKLKQDFPFSIGSCSLHEPDSDLQRIFGED